MRKFLKFFISTLVVVILLIIIAAVALPFIINPNDFKPQITEQVKKATGRELTLGGDINLSFFPWLGAELHKVSLSNAPGFRDIPFAKAAAVEVRVELLPLLQKRLVMDTVVLRDLSLNLARNAQGKTNWEDLVAKSSQETPAASKTPEEEATSGEAAAPLAAIAIAGLKIEAAQVHWRDEVKDVSYAIEQLNLTTDSFAPGEPTNVKLGFDFTSSQPEVHGHVDFGGEVTADIETNHYQVQDTALSLTAAGPALPIEQLALKLGADIEAFLAKQQLNISDLKLTSQVKKGPQEAQLALTTSLAGDLAAQQYRLKDLQLKTQVKDPQFPQPLSATLATTANLDLNKGTLALQDLSLAALGIQVNGHLNGTSILTEPHLKGQLVSNEFNPLQVAEALAIEIPPPADTSAPSKARLAMKFSASPKDFALNLGANIEAFLARQQLNTGDPKPANQAKGAREAQLTLVTSLEGDLAAQQYQLKALQLKTRVKDPQFPNPLNASLATTGTMDLKQGTLALQDISVDALGVQLNGHLNGTHILTEPHLSGQLVSNEFNPRRVAQALAIELPPTADASVLDKARLDLKFSASPKDFEAPLLEVTLDDSTLRGGLAVHNFQQPAIRFDLALNGINVDRYLPPPPPPSEKEAQPTPPVTPGGGAAVGAGQLPAETLRDLNVNGTLKIGKLTAGGAHSEDIRITLGARDGLITLHPLQAKLYQGVYAGNIQLDARQEPIKVAIDEKLTGIKAGPLLKDLTGDDKLLGTANINAKLTATGATPEAIRRTLSGTAGFSFTDGAVKGINIPQLIREAMARIEGKPLPPTNEPKQTDFAMLQGTITANDGLLRNTDLVAKSPFLRVHGQGTANLVQETIDYQLKVSVVKSLEGQGGGTLVELKDVTIPLKISGTFAQPDYGIDLESLIKARARKLINKNLDKGLDKLLGTQPGKEGEAPSDAAPTPQEQLKQELKDRLKDFF